MCKNLISFLSFVKFLLVRPSPRHCLDDLVLQEDKEILHTPHLHKNNILLGLSKMVKDAHKKSLEGAEPSESDRHLVRFIVLVTS